MHGDAQVHARSGAHPRPGGKGRRGVGAGGAGVAGPVAAVSVPRRVCGCAEDSRWEAGR